MTEPPDKVDSSRAGLPGVKDLTSVIFGNAYRILQEAIKAVPALRYALGVAGLISVVAIAQSFGIDVRLGGGAAIGMIFLMTLLVIFARLTKTANRYFLGPVLVLTWSSLLLTVASAALLFSSVFFMWPANLRRIIDGTDTRVIWQDPGTAEVDLEISDAQSWKLPPDRSFRSLDLQVVATNKSQLPVRLDRKALFVFAGQNGSVREEITLDLTTSNQEPGAELKPLIPTTLYLEGKLFPNHAGKLDQGLSAYVQIFYERSLSKEEKYFVTDFFDFSKSAIKWEGGD